MKTKKEIIQELKELKDQLNMTISVGNSNGKIIHEQQDEIKYLRAIINIIGKDNVDNCINQFLRWKK